MVTCRPCWRGLCHYVLPVAPVQEMAGNPARCLCQPTTRPACGVPSVRDRGFRRRDRPEGRLARAGQLLPPVPSRLRGKPERVSSPFRTCCRDAGGTATAGVSRNARRRSCEGFAQGTCPTSLPILDGLGLVQGTRHRPAGTSRPRLARRSDPVSRRRNWPRPLPVMPAPRFDAPRTGVESPIERLDGNGERRRGRAEGPEDSTLSVARDVLAAAQRVSPRRPFGP
jgi:hypothetical protein